MGNISKEVFLVSVREGTEGGGGLKGSAVAFWFPNRTQFLSRLIPFLGLLVTSCLNFNFGEPTPTDVRLPTCRTDSVTQISITTCMVYSTVTANVPKAISSVGIVWDTVLNPVLGPSQSNIYDKRPGSFNQFVNNLKPGTKYYIRTFAINNIGTAYGQPFVFTTMPGLVDTIGNEYKIVRIGTQVWMKENLRTIRYRNGEIINSGRADSLWNNTTSGAFSPYPEYTDNFTYGKLYNYYALVDPRGLCPVGWHAPGKDDWGTLEHFLGDSASAGGKMKALSNLWQGTNVGATDESGFSGLPGGERLTTFASIGTAGCWWSTESRNNLVSARRLSSNSTALGQLETTKSAVGYSVRCVKD